MCLFCVYYCYYIWGIIDIAIDIIDSTAAIDIIVNTNIIF